MKDKDRADIEEMTRQGMCERRWTEGRHFVMCGKDLPCPDHGGGTDIVTKLSGRIATEDEIRAAFDKFYQIPMNDTSMGVMMNMSLRDKIISDLKSKFIILKKPTKKEE